MMAVSATWQPGTIGPRRSASGSMAEDSSAGGLLTIRNRAKSFRMHVAFRAGREQAKGLNHVYNTQISDSSYPIPNPLSILFRALPCTGSISARVLVSHILLRLPRWAAGKAPCILRTLARYLCLQQTPNIPPIAILF